MRQIASAVEEGAKAYLHRQLVSVGLIAAVIFVILIFARGFYIFSVCNRNDEYRIKYMSWILMITYATMEALSITEYVLPYEFLRDDKIA